MPDPEPPIRPHRIVPSTAALAARLAVLLLAGLLAGAGCSAPAGSGPPDATRRAAWDVGSSTTKLKLARVDTRNGRILEVLLEDSAPVGYRRAAERHPENRLDEAIFEAGRRAIRKLRARAEPHGPAEHIGVATAAFREAANGRSFARRLGEATGIRLRVATAREEAILGFRAAVAAAGIPPERAIVWDIGGGSMQISFLGAGGRPVVYHGPHASGAFRDRVIHRIQGRDPARVDSPNPLGDRDGARAVALARELAGEVPRTITRRLTAPPPVQVLGIGGVHAYSIAGQVGAGARPYDRREVAASFARRRRMDDKALDSPYASTEVTNLALVLGFMQALGIDRVRPLRVNLADGLLVTAGAQSDGPISSRR